MEPNGKQLEKLTNVIISRYSPTSFAKLLLWKLDVVFENIVPGAEGFENQVYRLLDDFAKRDKLISLIDVIWQIGRAKMISS